MAKPSVLIIGAGGFGTSTAYHLRLHGYSSVRVLDRFDTPSHDAASTDLNKVVRADYPNPMYTRLAQEALEVWKSPTSYLSGLFHQTGWIMAANDGAVNWLESSYKTVTGLGIGTTSWLSGDETRARWPALNGPLDGWKLVFNSDAGWVPSGQALLRMANAAIAEGVEYVTGDDGYVIKLLYDDKKNCVGALTASGKAHFADTVIVANGAAIPTLLDANEESVATAGCLVVIKLTPKEIEKYKSIPIIDNFDQGIMFPPDEHGMMKFICNHGITNYTYSPVPGASITHSHGANPHDGIPIELSNEIRSFIRELAPELADRDWLTSRMCWDSQTKDLHFRICPYPKAKNLYVATCGAHHGFKFMPVIGKYVVDMLEGKLSEEQSRAWGWKDGKAPEDDVVDPHPCRLRDLGELNGWKDVNLGKCPPDRALRASL